MAKVLLHQISLTHYLLANKGLVKINLLHYIAGMIDTKTILRIDALGLGFTRLAAESGITRQTLINWHRGRTSPDPHKLKVFTDTLERLERLDKRRAGK